MGRSKVTIAEQARRNRVEELKDRAARLHYHGITEIKLNESEFATLFIENELNGNAAKLGGEILWMFYGLRVIKKGDTSSGN